MSWALADQAVVSAGNFITIYLLARFMDSGEFGLYMTGWIALLFLVSLQTAIISEPHNILGAQREGDAYRHLTTVLGTALLAGAAATGLLLCTTGLALAGVVGGRAGSLLMLLGAVAAPWMLQEFVRRVLYTRSETRAACANDAIAHGLQVAGIIAVVAFVEQPSIGWAFGVLGGSSLAAAVVGAWQIRRYLAPRGAGVQGPAIWRETSAFGKWLLARNVVSWLGQYGHNWLLLGMLGPAALGTFKAAEHLLNGLNPLRMAACAYLPPHASRTVADGGPGALRRWVRGIHLTVVLPFAGLILLLMIGAGPLLRLAYGDKFGDLPLHWIVVLGGVAAVVSFARVPLEMGVAAMRDSRALFRVHAWSVPLLFVAGTALIHRFGIFGVPLSGILIGLVLLVLTRKAFLRVVGSAAGVPAPALRRLAGTWT